MLVQYIVAFSVNITAEVPKQDAELITIFRICMN